MNKCFSHTHTHTQPSKLSEDRLVELLNSKADVSFNLLRYEDLPLDVSFRVHSIRSKKTQFGLKLLCELDTGFVFLPSRYTELFCTEETAGEKFFMKTVATYVTIIGFQECTDPHGSPDGPQTYNTPILQFAKTVDRKRAHSVPGLKTASGNSSIDTLAAAAAAFAEADDQKTVKTVNKKK